MSFDGHRDLIRVAWMQHDRNEARLALCRWVSRDTVQASRRLIERLAGFEHLRWLVIDSELVFAFQHVDEPRSGVTVGKTALPRSDCHFDNRRLRFLAVQFFLDVLGRDDSYFLAIFMELRERRSAKPKDSCRRQPMLTCGS